MDKFSPQEYDAWYKTPLGSLCDRLEKEAVFALFKPRGLVLDVGCGTGNYTLEIARRGAKGVGIDLSFDMALFAKTKAETQGLKTHFVVGRIEAMPFKKDVFDGVLGVTALCFISNAETAIVEISRVMKKGGLVILGELNRFSYWALLRRIKGLFKKSSYREARFFSLRKFKGLLEEAELKNLKWSSCIYFPPINSQWFLKGYRFFESAGKVLFPRNGAFIAIRGTK
ncbi:MAG: class I SAM-dependent methyltransferase [Deltaproteobacteria bacterium]|nr:class I SAM-dependent methyltransferase [Deltaproteobacteria bacterium]